MTSLFILSTLVPLSAAWHAQAFDQCGGKGWNGRTDCGIGYSCKKLDDWYSQCLPDTTGSVPGARKQYAQCGGKGYKGSTCCVIGWQCKYSNDWYSQCLPGYDKNQECYNIPEEESKSEEQLMDLPPLVAPKFDQLMDLPPLVAPAPKEEESSVDADDWIFLGCWKDLPDGIDHSTWHKRPEAERYAQRAMPGGLETAVWK